MEIEGLVAAIDRTTSRVRVDFGSSQRWFDVPDRRKLEQLHSGLSAAVSVERDSADIRLTVITASGSLCIAGSSVSG